MAIRLLVLISPKWSDTTTTRGDILLESTELQEIKTTRTKKAQEGVSMETSTSTALVSCDGLVPPPYIGNFMPPTPDLSFTGLHEFVNEPVVENSKAMSSKEEPKVVRKNDGAPIIEE
ncbi:hypothetical protein Tco_0196175 [Tanacetum coccineum]